MNKDYDCTGEYVGPSGPLPKNAEILARTMKEYMEWPDDENEADDAFLKLWERKTREVEALFPQYREDGPKMLQVNPYALSPDGSHTRTDEEEPMSSESPEEFSSETETYEDFTDIDSFETEDAIEINANHGTQLINPESDHNTPAPTRDTLIQNSALYQLNNLNAALIIPQDQQWTDLSEFGQKAAIASKFIKGDTEFTGPLAMYYGGGAMELKKKLLESPDGYNEAVNNILVSQMVDYIVQGEAAKAAMLMSDVPFDSLYMRMLALKKQMDGQVMKIIEAKQKLTSMPIKIRHAEQVNVGGVQQVNNNDEREGK